MVRTHRPTGFSLIELLLVLAILGILSGIAIPAFLGQRRRARVIGDAQSNAQVLRMQLETYKADNGIYGSGNAAYAWYASGATTGGSAAAALNFLPKGNSKMNYFLAISASGLGYTLTVKDPSLRSVYTSGATAFQTNQNGSILALLQ